MTFATDTVACNIDADGRRRVMKIDCRVKLDPDDLDRLGAIGHSIYVSNGGYAWYSTVTTGPIAIHQFVMGRVGQGNDGLRVDHINGDRLDNRKVNLRLVPDQINQINRKQLNRNNKSGHRGVSYMPSTSKWRATITVDRRSIHLGTFLTISEAATARREAELRYYSEPCPIPGEAA